MLERIVLLFVRETGTNVVEVTCLRELEINYGEGEAKLHPQRNNNKVKTAAADAYYV